MIKTVDEMPTECERSDVTLCGQQQQEEEEEPVQRLTQQAQQINHQQLMQHKINKVEKTIESESYTMEDVKELATNGEMSTSQTSTTSTTSSTNENGTSNGGSKKAAENTPNETNMFFCFIKTWDDWLLWAKTHQMKQNKTKQMFLFSNVSTAVVNKYTSFHMFKTHQMKQTCLKHDSLSKFTQSKYTKENKTKKQIKTSKHVSLPFLELCFFETFFTLPF